MTRFTWDVIEQLLGHRRGQHSHQLGLAGSVIALGLVLTGCGAPAATGGRTDVPDHVTASDIYLQSGVDRTAASERLESLRTGIDRLRRQSGSSWIGRQDDVTGYLTELAGGRYTAAHGDAGELITTLMDDHGPVLFGVTSAGLELGDPLTTKGVPTAAIRATQTVRGVPIRDGELVFTITDLDENPAVTSARGRVFSGIDVATTPEISAAKATRTAEHLSDGKAIGAPSLTVLPTGTGLLAWQVQISAAQPDGTLPAQDANYYIDAVAGDLADTRATNAGAQRAVAASLNSTVDTYEPQPSHHPIKVKGKDPQGRRISANAVRTPEGIKLVDTTVPTYDPETGEGGIVTYDAKGSKTNKGSIYTQQGKKRTISDREAIAAHAFSRTIYDYYNKRFGWKSWNGKGATLIVIVHFGDDSECNAYSRNGVLQFGEGCKTKEGDIQLVDIDVAGHETTHSVIDATSNLIYVGEAGALNESFADYFGNSIGDDFRNRDDSSLGEDSCARVSGPGLRCSMTGDGVLATRDMLTGNTYGDYLGLLTAPYKLKYLDVNEDTFHEYDQDAGGVHLNSSIWNNALWTIRTRLAALDGTTMLKSELVEKFDRAVFNTLTQLAKTAGFVDARNAIEQTILAIPHSDQVASVARQVFDQNKICADCAPNSGSRGDVVASGGTTQITPAAHGNRTVWLETEEIFGRPIGVTAGTTPVPVADRIESIDISFVGDSVVAFEEGADGRDLVVRYARSGRKTAIGTFGKDGIFSGLSGSENGAAWVGEEGNRIYFADSTGKVANVRIQDLQEPNKRKAEAITAVSTGKGTVGIGTSYGRILLWKPGSAVREVGRTDARVLVTATRGSRVMAIDTEKTAQLFERNRTNKPILLSEKATPYGATMDGRYCVWIDEGPYLGGGVAESEQVIYHDTSLTLYSSRTGKKYELLRQKGQQGFPALSGNTLVWQDTSQGGDDIRSGKIPGNL